MKIDLGRALAAEALGTLLLVATVIGSGIMAVRLADDNDAVALLANAIATGAMLFVLISVFGPISGAHFNPCVSLVFALRRDLTASRALGYCAAQILGGIGGTVAAHAMFAMPLIEVSSRVRSSAGEWTGEIIATFGLVLTILGLLRSRPESIPVGVALYITGAYWFTSSTSFANPAVSIARSLTESFAGIAPASLPGFIAAQFAGALFALGLGLWLFGRSADNQSAEGV